MNRLAIDRARDTLLAVDADSLTATAVAFLLREYLHDGADLLRPAIEHGLTRGLEQLAASTDAPAQLEWLRVLSAASAFTDDEELRRVVADALPAAVDALEADIRRAYEPGDGLIDRSCADHVRYALALVDAFDLCGRLPYAMLAEELAVHARRRWMSTDAPAFEASFAVNCSALRLLCGLLVLHDDPDYRAKAVWAPGTTFARDARALAAWIDQHSGAHPQDAADIGAALLDWFALASKLQ